MTFGTLYAAQYKSTENYTFIVILRRSRRISYFQQRWDPSLSFRYHE